MKLENVKFGDKFKTRNGEIAVVIGEHKTAFKHWYNFVSLREDGDMINDTPYKFSAYDDGRAFEGFDWLDIVEKIIIMKKNQIYNLCLTEACQKCFDEIFAKDFKIKYNCKSRKLKEIRRKVIKDCLDVSCVNEIRLIIDDYIYWIARNTHKDSGIHVQETL